MLETIAVKYYTMGYNCAESLFMAGNEMYNLGYDEHTARLFGAFGGGLQCGDLCGCLTGAAGVISALYIKTKAHDTAEIRSYTQLLIKEFEKAAGARKCIDIKPRLFCSDIRCQKTIIQGAIALENTINLINEKEAR